MTAFTQRQAHESKALATKAKSAEQAGKHQHAEQLLLTAIQKNPEDVDLRLQLAKSYLAKGETQLAVAALQKASEVQPENQKIYELWAQVLITNGQFDDALIPLNLGLRQKPNQVELLMMKGHCDERSERYQQAFDSYQRVVHIDPNHCSARVRMAQIQINWGKPNLAAPLLRAAIQDPNLDDDTRTEAWWLLGIVYGQEGRWQDAVTALRTSAKTKEKLDAEEGYRLAYAEFQAGEIGDALDRATEILKSQPDHQPTRAMLKILQLDEPSPDLKAEGVIQAAFEDELVPPSGW